MVFPVELITIYKDIVEKICVAFEREFRIYIKQAGYAKRALDKSSMFECKQTKYLMEAKLHVGKNERERQLT
ncbi:hypothetical protein LXL04_029721 [Taraxacum kok-saghyz]